MSAAPSPATGKPAPARLWLYRLLAALGLPALLVFGLEGGLRLAGYGRPVDFLIPDDQPGCYRSNPDFVSRFMPAIFDLRPLNLRVAVRKPADTIRVVVLGESAAQGIPAPAFGFAPQLRAQLRARYPGKNIELINTGIVAINSHVVYQIVRNLADFSPDLFVVYMGNNEVVGPYGPGCAYLSAMPPLPLIRLSVFFRSTRTGQLLGAALARLGRHNSAAGEWRGMSTFIDSAVAGDDSRLEAVYRNFEANLDDIVRVANRAGAKTLLCTVVSNLRDCAPLLSQHRAGLTPAELAAWQRAFNRGTLAWRLGENAAARADLIEALRLDPQYADTTFMLGRLELESGETAAARGHLLDAQHWDALRFRPDPRINAIIRQVAARHPGTGLFDAALMMGSDPASTGEPAGRQYLFEHVHLNWTGNGVLARGLAEQAAALLGGDTSRGAWLDEIGCAAALAYTPHEYPAVLHRLAEIVTAPPFTNQLTYAEDQARLARDQAAARAAATTPETLQRAATVVAAAMAADPLNPDLAKIAEQIADDRGDLEKALAESRRAQQLQPANFALAGDEAIKLARLGRDTEAEQLLRETARTCTARDLVLLAPAFADLFTRTKRFDEARRYFDTLINAQPAEPSLRLLRGRLARLAGDTAAAEKEYRAILAEDPANQNTTEELVAMLAAAGRDADAEAATLAAAGRQPRNQANNLRAAILCEQRHDDTAALGYLLAAERSGPVNAAFEMHVARKLFAQNRRDEALDHLAVARQLARMEGDAAAVATTEKIIAQLRAQAP